MRNYLIPIIFAALISTVSFPAMQAFAGMPCNSDGSGDWNDPANWKDCIGPTPGPAELVVIQGHDITITGNEDAGALNVQPSGSLFINCDASLTFGEGAATGPITNHGTFTAINFLLLSSTFSNSGTFSGVVEQGGSIVEIATICDMPIGGTVRSMSTTSLLVAGAQANMGLLSLALVGAVAIGAAITYKVKSKKTEQ